MKKLIFVSAMVFAFVPKVWAGAGGCPMHRYTVVPYTFSVSMWGSQGPAAPSLARNLIPQEPIFGVDENDHITSAASLAECNAMRNEVNTKLHTERVMTSCHPTTPVVLEGPIQ